MTTRTADIVAFLDQHGWGDAERQPLPGDASFRRYHRLHRETNSSVKRAMLMDAPPPENIRPFIAIAELLHRQRLSAPVILGRNEASGLLLLEDFGDDTYTRLLNQGVDSDAVHAAPPCVLGLVPTSALPRLRSAARACTALRAAPGTFASGWRR